MKILAKYIIALVNLYGMVTPETVREIYNEQNTAQISLEEVEAYLADPPKELAEHAVYVKDGYFVQEILLEDKEFAYLQAAQQGKSAYVPVKEELFQYVDELYFEKNRQYERLHKYLLRGVFPRNTAKADEFCQELFEECQYDFQSDRIALLLGEYAVPMDQATLDGLLPMIMAFAEHSRRWEHKGHTPEELSV